ncbi:MAG: HEAT repeat domain-containing protein [Promethearchaeota archaeon]
MERDKGTSLARDSRYSIENVAGRNYEVYFDEHFARKYLPLTHSNLEDDEANLEAVYYRIVRDASTGRICIQYIYYWDFQYVPFLPWLSHSFDYEPIFCFLNKRGGVDEVYYDDLHYSVGHISPKNPDHKRFFEGVKPKFLVTHLWHSFDPYDGIGTEDASLKKLTDDVLTKWWSRRGNSRFAIYEKLKDPFRFQEELKSASYRLEELSQRSFKDGEAQWKLILRGLKNYKYIKHFSEMANRKGPSLIWRIMTEAISWASEVFIYWFSRIFPEFYGVVGSVSILKQALKIKDSKKLLRVVETLKRISFVKPEVVLDTIPSIARFLDDKYLPLRRSAIEILAWISNIKPEAIIDASPNLMGALKDKPSICRRAIYILSRVAEINPGAFIEIVPLLIERLRSPDSLERRMVISTLHIIGKSKPEVVAPLLAEELMDDSISNWPAIEVLNRIGNERPDVVIKALAPLIEMIRRKHSSVRWHTVETIDKIGSRLPDSITHFFSPVAKLLRRKQPKTPELPSSSKVKKSTASRISKITPMLMKSLKHKHISVRCRAIEAVGKIGNVNPEAVIEAIDPIMDALKHKNPELRRCAVEALGRIGGAEPDLIGDFSYQLLMKFATDPDISDVVSTSLVEIGKVKPNAIIPSLIDMFDSADSFARGEICTILSKIGTKPSISSFVTPLLIKALKDSETLVRWKSIVALGRMGGVNPDAVTEAIPLLEEMLKDRNPTLRASASITLDRIKSAKHDRLLPR